MTSLPLPDASLPLLLAGRTVLVIGDAAAAAPFERAGAIVRRSAAFGAAELEGVALVLAPAGHPALAAAAGRNILASVLPPPVSRAGRVSLVGAGPGAADLLTVRAVEALRTADVVLFDKLVGPEALALIPPGVRRVDVGKRCGRHAMSQAAINALILREARAGGHVVRLKGGDPFVFGRGGEELASLRAAGVPVEVVPGITAALATAARLGIPLTHRGASRSLHFITAHGADDRLPEHDWTALARTGGTLAVYMGVRTLRQLADRLCAAGLDPATPAIAVENASLAGERRIRAPLAGLADAVDGAGVTGPTIVLIGAVVALGDALGEPARLAA